MVVDGTEEENISAQDMYGAGAVTGSKVDLTNVQIQTSNTTQIQTGEVTPNDDTNVTPEETTTDTTETKEPTVEEQVAQQLEAGKALEGDLVAKGVDFTSLENEYMSTGTLSAESLAILDKAGYPKAVVDAYINGMQATATQFENFVYGVAGGKDEYAQIVGHIKTKGDAYIKSFNQALDRGDTVQIELMMNGIKSQLITERGTRNPSLMTKGGRPTGTIAGFTTRAEMVTAMSDPRYNREASYTKSVRAKMDVSTFTR